MTIPQADSSHLCSVSDRQEVTLAEVGEVDQTAEVVTKSASLAEEQQAQNSTQQEQSEKLLVDNINPLQSACVEALLINNKENEETIGKEKEDSEKNDEKEIGEALEDVWLKHGPETNQNALSIINDVRSPHESHSIHCQNELWNEKINNVATLDFDKDQIKVCQSPRDVSLPLLKIPSYSSIPTPSVSYDHRNRKSSINFPIQSNRDSIATTTTAVAISSSSSSSSYSSVPSSSSSLSNSRKTRRKSLPQRLGLRYQKIPQDEILSPSESDKNVDAGVLNLQYIPSPDTTPFSSSSQDHQDHLLSFHNAEVHASFHRAQTSAVITSPHQQQSTSQVPTSSHPISQSQSFPRDVTLKTTKQPINTPGSKFSKKDQKTPISATSGSSSKPRSNKPGRGGSSKNNTSLPLRRTLSLSLKSINDLSAVHPAGRGSSNKKKYRAHSRSVSTEDLANCRIHRTGGGRAVGDPHPSPGSPSHCCLVSVSRVPMAAATSHLTLDSEYQTVRLAVLGAPGVGKSSIVKQFVMQQFLEEYVPTEERQIFCPAVIINDHLYEVRIIDCPYIPYFPVNSLYEWTDFRGYGLRNATAYVLVYDITSEESFEYIKSLRLQILESRNLHDVPIFVVGNKHDLAEERGVPRREVANLVKKQWKCGYMECSAKYNWHIMLLFKELMKTVDYIDYGHKPTSLRVQDALRRNRCLIL